MRTATPQEEMALLAYMASYDPVHPLCARCHRRTVAEAGACCIVCANTDAAARKRKGDLP
jgi:hypothetical protein